VLPRHKYNHFSIFSMLIANFDLRNIVVAQCFAYALHFEVNIFVFLKLLFKSFYFMNQFSIGVGEICCNHYEIIIMVKLYLKG